MQRPQPETVTLNDVLITEELSQRPPRSSNLQAENQAMRSLIQQMVNEPEMMLQSLVEMAVELCQAESAGVSLLETTIDGKEIFRWTVLAGTLSPFVGGTTPRSFSPCGVCLNRVSPQLFSHPERYFTYFQETITRINAERNCEGIAEGLVLPLIADDHVLGTIWILSHDEQRQFDSEDVRIMTGLADFAAANLLLSQRQTRELLAKNAQLEAEALDRKQAEAQLRESEERLRLATEAAQMYAWEFDLQTQTPKFSANYERVTGLQPLSHFEENLQFVHPDDRAIVSDAFAQAIAQDDQFDYEMRAFDAEQQINWYRVSGTIIRDPNHQPHRAVGIAQKITDAKHREVERKQSEAELRQAQRRLELALTGANFGVWTYNVSTDEFWADDRAQQMHGHAPHEVHTFAEAGANIHPEDGDRAAAFAQAIQTRSKLQIEYRVIWRDGSIHSIASYAEFIPTGEQDEGIFYGVAQDISDRVRVEDERKQAEAALRESEARSRALIENLPGGAVFVVDRNLRYLLAEGEALSTAGFKPEDFVGQTIFEVLPPELAANYEVLYRQALRGETFEHEHDAHNRSYLSRGLPIRSSTGEVYAVLAVSYDITDRKRAERALRESEAKYRMLFEAIDEGFVLGEAIRRADGTIDFLYSEVNPAYEAITGIPKEYFIGRTTRAVVPHLEEEWYDIVGRVGFGGESIRVEQRAEAINLWLNAYFAPVGEPGSGKLVVVFQNITDRKRAEADRIQLIQEQANRLEAERMSQIKDEFLAMVSHELQSPLVAILGWTRLLRANLPAPAMLMKHLQTIERNASVQAKLVQDLLDISRITAGKLRLILQHVELESVIESAIAAVNTAAIVKNINLQYQTTNQAIAAVWVMGDRDRLQQILCNLLINAIKFTPDAGSVTVVLSLIEAENCPDAACAEIRVVDTGIGISADFLPHIFDRFRQAEKSGSAGGLGLGLAIAHHLVELHNGTIQAESAGEGQGATFIIKLPLLETNKACQ